MTMVSVFWLGALIVFGVTLSGGDAINYSDLSTEESFIVHATEISNILQTLISLVTIAAENEGRILNIPKIPFPLDFESSTLEELFDKFERSSQSFRTKFFKFIKKELESIDSMEDLVCTNLSSEDTEYVDCESASTEYPGPIVAVVELDSDERAAEEVSDHYLETDADSYVESLYTLAETDPKLSESIVEISSGDIVEPDTATEYASEQASSDSPDPLEVSHEATTEQILEQFFEEVNKLGEETEADSEFADSGRTMDRSGLSVLERPLNIPITLVPGVAGVDFPDYEYIPITSFTCEDKEYTPGFYADLEADCQVFHVCWHDRYESFLCPPGTQFNQQTLACDYWFNLNCSKTTDYYSVNADFIHKSENLVDSAIGEVSESYQTLSLLGYDMRIMPISFAVTPFSELETSEPKVTSTTEAETVVPVTEDLVHRIYEELSSFKSENDPERQSANIHQKKQRSNAKFIRIKLDRSGHTSETPDFEPSSEIPVTAESVYTDVVTDSSTVSATSSQTPVSEESVYADIQKKFFIKEKGGKRIYVDKSVIPIILNRLFETADDVINKNILPFTKEVLVASYSKLHKVKKH